MYLNTSALSIFYKHMDSVRLEVGVLGEEKMPTSSVMYVLRISYVGLD